MIWEDGIKWGLVTPIALFILALTISLAGSKCFAFFSKGDVVGRDLPSYCPSVIGSVDFIYSNPIISLVKDTLIHNEWLLGFVVFLVFYFMTGAIIGLIYGKIKSSRRPDLVR
jgi:hypothetical protein